MVRSITACCCASLRLAKRSRSVDQSIRSIGVAHHCRSRGSSPRGLAAPRLSRAAGRGSRARGGTNLSSNRRPAHLIPEKQNNSTLRTGRVFFWGGGGGDEIEQSTALLRYDITTPTFLPLLQFKKKKRPLRLYYKRQQQQWLVSHRFIRPLKMAFFLSSSLRSRRNYT